MTKRPYFAWTIGRIISVFFALLTARPFLKPAWYLITGIDYWNGLTQSPLLPEAPALMATFDQLFGGAA